MIIQKIKDWNNKRKAQKISEEIYIQVDLFIYYYQKDIEKIDAIINSFNEKFYPHYAEERKGFSKFLRKMSKNDNLSLDELKKMNFTKEEIKNSLKLKKGGKLMQWESIFSKKGPINKFEKLNEEVEQYSQKFFNYNKNGLNFNVKKNIDFSDILNLSEKDIRILQTEVLSKIKFLKDINFLEMKKEAEKT